MPRITLHFPSLEKPETGWRAAAKAGFVDD